MARLASAAVERQSDAQVRIDPRAQAGPKRISVLGATGSIGESTLDLIGRSPDRFEVVAITALNNAPRLAALAVRHRARLAVIGEDARYGELKGLLAGTGIDARAGEAALIEAAAEPADCVMAAIVGAAGLKPTFAAARARAVRASRVNRRRLERPLPPGFGTAACGESFAPNA